MVVGNPLIRSTAQIPHIFQASAFGAAASGNDFFRPIQTLSYILDYRLFGLDASGFHVMSLLYFLLACGMLFYLLTLLARNEPIGDFLSKKAILAIVFLFALHPLNIEVITYISGRGDVLFLLFALIALCGTVISAQNRSWGIPLTWISVLLAILSKENAIALPFVLGLFWLILPKHQQGWRYWTAVIPPIIGNLGYIGYRMMALGNPTSSPLSTIAVASLGERILTLPYILWTYFRLTFIPYPLHMEYLNVVTDIINPYLWLGFPIVCGTLFFLWKTGAKGIKRTGMTNNQIIFNRVYIFLLAWVALGIGPVLQFIPLTATVREHWFSFSLIAAIILIVVCLRIQETPKWQKHTLFGIILLLFMGITYTRNLDWEDPMQLYSHDVALEPRSFLLHNNIGVLQYRNGNFSDAKQAFQKSVLVTPNDMGYGTALNNLGVIAEQEKNISEALSYYQRSIVASHYELAYANALRILVNNNQWQTAYPLAKEAINAYPYHQDILRYATMISFQLGYRDEGESLLKRLKQLYPE